MNKEENMLKKLFTLLMLCIAGLSLQAQTDLYETEVYAVHDELATIYAMQDGQIIPGTVELTKETLMRYLDSVAEKLKDNVAPIDAMDYADALIINQATPGASLEARTKSEEILLD